MDVAEAQGTLDKVTILAIKSRAKPVSGAAASGVIYLLRYLVPIQKLDVPLYNIIRIPFLRCEPKHWYTRSTRTVNVILTRHTST